jgi:hypothetical protein
MRKTIWSAFEKTGDIGAYLLLKDMENVKPVELQEEEEEEEVASS